MDLGGCRGWQRVVACRRRGAHSAEIGTVASAQRRNSRCTLVKRRKTNEHAGVSSEDKDNVVVVGDGGNSSDTLSHHGVTMDPVSSRHTVTTTPQYLKSTTMVRQLKHHEQRLLKKVDFLNVSVVLDVVAL